MAVEPRHDPSIAGRTIRCHGAEAGVGESQPGVHSTDNGERISSNASRHSQTGLSKRPIDGCRIDRVRMFVSEPKPRHRSQRNLLDRTSETATQQHEAAGAHGSTGKVIVRLVEGNGALDLGSA
jgi:hypothetical protein